ncbi:hypothetical protein GCM10008968_33570 [Bacillus horti]
MSQRKVPIIAITGSTGKSTTKEMTDSILRQRLSILKTPGNKNLPLHIKKTMSGLTPKHKAVLLEVGMGRKGAGHRACRYMKPDYVVYTNIGSAHIGNLGNSVQDIATNKSVLMKYMNKGGIVLLNQDDPHSNMLDLNLHKGKFLKVGIHNEADFRATDVKSYEDGIEFTLKTKVHSIHFKIPIYGFHNVYNALFAIALARQFRFSYEDIKAGLEKFKPPIKRMRAYKLANNSLLLDDSVNANPESVVAAINVLNEKRGRKKAIVVLGSMLELGEMTEKAHREMGTYLASNKIDVIYTYGRETLKLKESALAAGFIKEKIHCFNDRHELHKALMKADMTNSVILIKGSAGTKMGLTAELIRQHHSCRIQIHDDQSSEEVQMHPVTFTSLCLSSKLMIHFGSFSKKINVNQNEGIPLDTIRIPKKLTKEITIPDLEYETRLQGNHLHIGPVIGLAVLPLYINDPEKQNIRFAGKKFKGLIYMFRPRSDHRHSKVIQGYYYDPKKKTFIEGTFPFPSAIFNRVMLKPTLHRIYSKKIGHKIFNYPYSNTDKWTFWSILSKNKSIKKYLPKTVKYTGVSSALKMVKKHRDVYVKPRNMAGGSGILVLRKSNKRVTLYNQKGKKWDVHSSSHLKSLLKKIMIKGKSYIVQESIFSDYEKGKIDFRAYVQKDSTGNWTFTGLETKVGKSGSIISNSKNRQEIMPGEKALQTIFRLNEQESKRKINGISTLGIKIMKLMEPHHKLLGDAAIDFVIDPQLRIRILEVQLNYAAEIKQNRTEDERQILPSILFTPFEYATYLAGFSSMPLEE